MDLASLGLLGVFLAALAAGSLLPFPSEGVLIAVIAGGADPWGATAIATLGNVLGAATVFAIGWALAGGGPAESWLARRVAGDPHTRAAARARMVRWGSPALLLAWVPIVGDVLVLGAGLLRVHPGLALFLVSLGKAVRYALVAGGTLAAF